MTNWPRLIARLRRKLPAGVIAGLCGHSPSWLSRLASGDIDQPGHAEGERLISLYREKISEDISDLQKGEASTV